MALMYFAQDLKRKLMDRERKLNGFVSRKNIDPAVRETYQRRIFVPEELLEVGYMNDFEKKRMLKYAAPGCRLDEVILFANHYHDDTPKFMPGNSTCKQGTVIARERFWDTDIALSNELKTGFVPQPLYFKDLESVELLNAGTLIRFFLKSGKVCSAEVGISGEYLFGLLQEALKEWKEAHSQTNVPMPGLPIPGIPPVPPAMESQEESGLCQFLVSDVFILSNTVKIIGTAKGGSVSQQSRIVHPGFKSPVSIGRIEVSGQPVSSAPERQTAVLDVSIPPYIVKPGDVLGIES
ncbi:MAG: hypothetical protein HUJ54_02635 [Erysipelotrichaceae bacterium]|nr:hypothetical protein [Erysipelotrichaceae bacterium]